MFGCKHEWKKIKETYAPPYQGPMEGGGFIIERLAKGITTILFECIKCHQIKKEEMLGS